ncbi:MAG: 2-C-methyl-D-erythritol 4-phosphate cytidylyltransferase [Sedimentisphaerales bacterium]|jgi:2-C-methyl-D-erythritol 4-phosphate cytidylyltransferase
MGKVHAIILAAGIGKRARYDIPKQFIKIAGKTIVEHTIEIFEKNHNIDDIIIVVLPMYKTLMEEIILKNNYKKVSKILSGGETRRESSFIGIDAIKDDNDIVLMHDAIRPFLSDRIISQCLNALKKYDAIDVAIPSADTIIEVNDGDIIEDMPVRKFMLRGQTPQGFRVGVIKKAHQMANKDKNVQVTDDCGLVFKYNLAKVHVVRGEANNIKITYPEDVFLAESLFKVKNMTVSQDIPLSGLAGKVIVVFGASRGIGQHIMDLAAKHRAKAYGFSRTNNVDVSSCKAVEKALRSVYRKEKRIDYIVDTAAILKTGKIESRDIEDITYEINTNYTGAVYILKAGIEYVRKTRGSILLFTSSSYTRGRALYSIYSSTKAAIVNLVQAAAEELAPYEVTVNALNPERTATPMRRENFGNEPGESLLDPHKVALVSLQTLLSDMTGQVVYVKRSDVPE